MPVLVLLPLSAFGLLLLLFIGGKQRGSAGEAGPVRSVLSASVVWGAYLALGSELLSLLGQLKTAGVAMLWLAANVILLAIGLRRGALALGVQRLKSAVDGLKSWPAADKLLLAAGGIEVLILFAVALVAPPNNADSLLYHMARVAHWIQEGSLQHYAAIYDKQLWSPIWAELAILHGMVLWGTDRFANLVQWGAMVGSITAIVAAASRLGASRRAKLLAALFGASVPMALLQATSTQTDLVVAFWSITTVYFLLSLVQGRWAKMDWLLLGGAVGLGILTKATFYPYLGLPLVGAGVYAWRRGRQAGRELLLGAAVAAFAALILNAGFWTRNIKTYQHPFGPMEEVRTNANLALDPRVPLVNGVHHLALNFSTPWEGANSELIAGMNAFAASLGQPDDSFDLLWRWNHEDSAGNPVHIVILVAVTALALGAHGGDRLGRVYAAGCLLSFLSFAWAFDVDLYRMRFHLTLLFLGAPLVALLADRFLGSGVQAAVTGLLLLLALPWIFFNRTRPVVGLEGHTRIRSVFTASRAEALFANARPALEPFSAAAEQVKATQCRQVGLRLDPIDVEYVHWWLLGAPDDSLEIRGVNPPAELAHLVPAEFDPCVVLCTNCSDEATLGVLPLLGDFDGTKVYGEEEA